MALVWWCGIMCAVFVYFFMCVCFCVVCLCGQSLLLLSRSPKDWTIAFIGHSEPECRCRQLSGDISLSLSHSFLLSHSLCLSCGIPFIVLYNQVTLYQPTHTHTLSFLLQSSRINDQRSPDPRTLVARKSTMPSEDFFNLIQHLQSTRIEDQRSPLPVLAN